MKNLIQNIKIKYAAEALAFIMLFLIFAAPALAEEISPQTVIKYVNQARKANGISPLSLNEKLTKVAQDKLNDMIENKYFAHTSPSGKSPWHWFSQNEYDYQFAGENLAINFLKAEDQHKAWMNSPTHKKNILNVNFVETGIAIGAGEIDGQLSIIAVEVFGTPVGVNPLEGGKSFSAPKDSGLLKDEGKIIPQVLSMKNTKVENGAPQKMIDENRLSFWQIDKQWLIDFAETLSALLLMISLALIPIVFLGAAGKNIYAFYLDRKKQEEIKI